MPSPLPVSRPFFSPHPCSLSSLRISWALYNFTRPVKTLRVEWLMPRFGAHSLLADLHLRKVSSIASRQYAPRVAKSRGIAKPFKTGMLATKDACYGGFPHRSHLGRPRTVDQIAPSMPTKHY